MMLLFLLLFAFLALAVVRQVERLDTEPDPPVGHCPGCGNNVEADWMICPRCKELLQNVCPGCGRSLPVYHRFCADCGTPRAKDFGGGQHEQKS
ncbi:MAG: zinc ribbon domain-containing protein [Desulfuromonadales bacterium]|nr:zinc ribbon domain-containing protein [Desulfuromonadales bacterium]MDW7757569.1 zinc ribbon domain-containing protein [Desulfuromonadales bacterium]